jgi:hypothetical protein
MVGLLQWWFEMMTNGSMQIRLGGVRRLWNIHCGERELMTKFCVATRVMRCPRLLGATINFKEYCGYGHIKGGLQQANSSFGAVFVIALFEIGSCVLCPLYSRLVQAGA